MCDPIPLCFDFPWLIGSGEVVHLKILLGFETCLIAWPPCFVRCFLQTTTKSSWTSSWTSKVGFFLSCVYVQTFVLVVKISVVEGQLLFRFDNAFTFALSSWTFSPFTRYTPSIAFLDGVQFQFETIPFRIHSFVTPLLSMFIDIHLQVFLVMTINTNKLLVLSTMTVAFLK
jgi:hypothetical protein